MIAFKKTSKETALEMAAAFTGFLCTASICLLLHTAFQ